IMGLGPDPAGLGPLMPARPIENPPERMLKYRRPTSPWQTDAFQSGLITQVSSLTTLLRSPSCRLMCDSGTPLVVPSRSRIDRVLQELPRRLSLSYRLSICGKCTGFAFIWGAVLMVLAVRTPELLYVRQDRGPVLRR